MIQKIIDKKAKFGINIAIVASFAVIAIFSVYLLIHQNVINGAWDLPFHWGRMYELVNSYHHHVFLPHYNITAMGGNGTAVMLLYPYITLLPFVIILLFFKFSISLFYLFFAFLYFEGLLISFYSSKSISRNNLTSYVFSVLYCTSSIFMAFSFTNMDVGALLSFIYMPLVIFGFIAFLKNNKWIEMTIGTLLIIFSHVLSIILIFSFIFIWFLVDIKQILYQKNKMINLCKAIVSVLLISSFILVPAIIFIINNKIKSPINFGMPSSLDLLSLFYTSMTNNITMSWGLSVFAVVGFIIMPLIFYHKFSPTIKKLYWLSFGFAIFSTGLFPWEQSLAHTPLNIIQFPWRLDTVPQLIFIYIFSVCMTQYLNHKVRPLYVPLVILITLMCQLSAQKQVISIASRQQSHEIAKMLFKDDNYYSPYNAKINQTYLNYHLAKNSEINYVIKSKFPVNDYPDYYPKQSFAERESLSNDVGIYGSGETMNLKEKGNGTFQIVQRHPKEIKNFIVPFIDYNFVKYHVYDEHGKLISFHRSASHLIEINKLASNTNDIRIHIVPSKLSYLYNSVTILGILYFGIEILKAKNKRSDELISKLLLKLRRFKK